MPTIKDSLYFSYDGKLSQDFGLIHITTSNSMYTDTLVGSRDILETRINGNDTPYFNGVTTSPIEINMEIAFENDFNDEMINEVVMWLFQDKYKPLYFIDKPDKVFYCLPIGDSNIVHNGLKQGYITLTMRCNSPYAYSPIYLSERYDLSTNIGKYQIELENRGHFELFPEISIEKIEDGHLTFTNISNGGEIFEVRDLTNLEQIYINSEKEIIETDIVGVYRYDKVIGNYIELPYGRNIIEVEGKCKIQFRYQYKFRF